MKRIGILPLVFSACCYFGCGGGATSPGGGGGGGGGAGGGSGPAFYSFQGGTDGSFPGALIEATDGNFYGPAGGNGGTVFRITPGGILTTLHRFCPGCFMGGDTPIGLVQAADGNLYGITGGSGQWNGSQCWISCGEVFRITLQGQLTTLHTFSGGADGRFPGAALVQGADGNFYGTTTHGGANGYGTVFNVTPAGALTTLYSFCSQPNCIDGLEPTRALVQAADGDFYGTTYYGGASSGCNGGGCGTVFKITLAGVLTTLYSFCSQANCTDGSEPIGLVQASDGNFYGTTLLGGANSSACSSSGCGTVFRITGAGELTTLYSFCSQTNCTDGASPVAALMQASDGNFYGTTMSGGANSSACSGSGCGTVFKITAAGQLSTLYSFCSKSACADGSQPGAGLLQASNKTLYGTTVFGGTHNLGTVFALTVE